MSASVVTQVIMATTEKSGSYSQFACIGTGFSGIGLGATLKRWHNITDLVMFEREGQLGGTWSINQYPGTLRSLYISAYFKGARAYRFDRMRLRRAGSAVQLLL